MEKFLFTGKDLTSGIKLPADVRKMLSFIASWDDDLELSLWYDDTYINVFQTRFGLWTLYEAARFKIDLIAAGIAFRYCDFLLSSEAIHRSSCDCVEYVTALCISRAYIVK